MGRLSEKSVYYFLNVAKIRPSFVAALMTKRITIL
jgi:hypothetical protein